MKHKIFFLIILMTLNSCKKISQDKNELSQETPVIQKDQKNDSKSEEYNNNNEQQQIKCEEYWARRFPGDSLKARYINEVISINKLTKNNLIFLNALIN